METMNLTISGMTCGSCVKHVEKVISSIEGVQSVSVDLAAGTAKVDGTFPNGVAPILAALEEDGYRAQVGTSETGKAKSGSCGSGSSCCCG